MIYLLLMLMWEFTFILNSERVLACRPGFNPNNPNNPNDPNDPNNPNNTNNNSNNNTNPNSLNNPSNSFSMDPNNPNNLENFFKNNTNQTNWGAWIPPNDSDWSQWKEKWGKENSSRFDSTEKGRDPKDGWPQWWKGMGKGNPGVPPPPWAYVPTGYGKPLYCFMIPVKGHCQQRLVRWAYNPTVNDCNLYEYSGCGANQNNFLDRDTCVEACVNPPSTGCEVQSKFNFEELIYE